MALQLRQHVFRLDQNYIDRFEHTLDDNDLTCFSCGKEFKPGDWIFSKYRSTGGKGQNMVKRHVSCAILKNIITKTEARRLAPELYYCCIAFAFLAITALHIIVK